ncbi:MAG TPA: ABC transporter substrate-binding protein [Acidimicrobiales bacterium]|nr:ABC transporter substrate-binding protein [Acidimicrobiales bacterium]
MLAVLAVAALAAAGCSSAAVTHFDSKGAWSGHVIAFGAVYSSTGAGSAYGPQSILGAKLAASQINAAGGVRGAKIQITFRDDGSVPANAAALTGQLITSQHVLALLGPSLTNTSAAAHALADQEQTVMMATSNVGQGIVGDCAFPCTWIFRDSLGDATAIPANIAEVAQSAHPTTAAILSPATGDTLGADQAQIAQEALPPNHIGLLASVSYPTDGSSLVPAVTQAIAGHPDVLFIGGTSSPELVQIIQVARQLGFLGQFLGGNTMNSTAVATGVGAAGIGGQSASAWFEGNAFPANTTFVTSYENAYHQTPDQFAAQAYTGVQLFADAAAQAQLSFTNLAADRRQFRTALEGVKVQTALGPFSFTPGHDVQQPIWIIQLNGQGGFTLITSELNSPPS